MPERKGEIKMITFETNNYCEHCGEFIPVNDNITIRERTNILWTRFLYIPLSFIIIIKVL